MAEVIPFYRYLLPSVLHRETTALLFLNDKGEKIGLFLGGKVPNTWRVEKYDLVVDSIKQGDGAFRVPWNRIVGLRREGRGA